MQSEARPTEEDNYFVCSVCGMREKYHVECDAIKRFGLRFLEKVFFVKDGAGEDLGGFAVGSHCSVCRRAVCHASDCSVFYAKRFCKACFLQHSLQFPPQMRQAFGK